MRVPLLILLIWSSLAVAADDVGDGTQISGSLTFTCTPDEKSKNAGAAAFDDTLDLGNDRVKSAVLAKVGFPPALLVPKLVNGVPTFTAIFRKAGVTATYFIRAKPGGEVSGSFTRVEGGKTLRYTLGASTPRESANGHASKIADVMLDPEVLRINGGFVRLMSVQVAMADAGVNADKSRLAAILKSAGVKQDDLRTGLASHKLKPDQYVKQAEAVLSDANKSVQQLLGNNAEKVQAAYDAPFASGYVYLNQMRAAAAESNATSDAVKLADQAVYKSLLDLARLAKKKDELTSDAVATIKQRAHTEVVTALGEAHRKRLEETLASMASYKPR